MSKTTAPKPEKESRERPLTDREEDFCRNIVLGSTRIDAYVKARYRNNNRKTAYSSALRLFRKAKIQARIAVLRAEIAAKFDLTAANIFKQCAAILNSDARNYSKWGPTGVTLKASSELTEIEALAVEEISETVTKEGGTIRYKLHPKTKALEIGAKLLGLLIEKQQITGADGGPIAFTSLDRAAKLQRLIELAQKRAKK
ncbi:MAG: terminase small subunit [bacterium]